MCDLEDFQNSPTNRVFLSNGCYTDAQRVEGSEYILLSILLLVDVVSRKAFVRVLFPNSA